MPDIIFQNFEEVEESVRKNAPAILYKYREDWENKYHKELITAQSIWMASPKELNDPYDIRIPFKFDFSEIEHPEFFRKMKEYYKINNPYLNHNERDLNVICENKLEEIRKDPRYYFEKNYKDLRESNTYDQVGVFSCTSDELNEKMWAHYGNNNTGFVVGFNTVELCRELLCGFSPVKYNDQVLSFSFINKSYEDTGYLYLKSKKWEYEKEFRFITLGIEKESERIRIYSLNSISEFIIGSNFPNKYLREFISEIRNKYSKDIPIFKVQVKVSEFGLEKYRIN